MSHSQSPVNLQDVLKITNNKLELAKEMIAMLGAELPNLQSAINQAYQAQNYSELHTHIHKLHGSCCYCGVPQLRKLSAELEEILKIERYLTLDALIAELNIEINHILKYMKEQGILT